MPADNAALALTSRTYTTVQGEVATFGTAVPTLSPDAALRVGKSQIFGGLEDTRLTTIASGTPGTYRTNFGLIEIGGADVTIEVAVLLSNSLYHQVRFRFRPESNLRHVFFQRLLTGV